MRIAAVTEIVLENDADFTRLLQDARTSNAEGWVIRDSTGYMVKIKAPGYSTTKRARAIPALVDYLREPSEQRRGTQADREKLERNAERLGLNLSDYIVSTISRHRAWDLPRLAPHLKDLLHGVNTHGRLD